MWKNSYGTLGSSAEESLKCRAVWERRVFPHHTADSVPGAGATSFTHTLVTKICPVGQLGDIRQLNELILPSLLLEHTPLSSIILY